MKPEGESPEGPSDAPEVEEVVGSPKEKKRRRSRILAPFLGLFSRNGKSSEADADANADGMIYALDIESPHSAEIRRLLWKIKDSGGQGPQAEPLQVLAITSSTPEEGKTTTSVNLAVASAMFGSGMTLLVDGDLRRPRIHQMLGMSRGPGFSELLAGRVGMEECLRPSPQFNNLQVITSGHEAGQPSTLLAADRIRALFSEWKGMFDLIIVDTPPAVPLVDATVIASSADGALMVVRVGKTPRAMALRAREVLFDARVNLIGGMVNDVEQILPRYYYNKRGYYYYYSK